MVELVLDMWKTQDSVLSMFCHFCANLRDTEDISVQYERRIAQALIFLETGQPIHLPNTMKAIKTV